MSKLRQRFPPVFFESYQDMISTTTFSIRENERNNRLRTFLIFFFILLATILKRELAEVFFIKSENEFMLSSLLITLVAYKSKINNFGCQFQNV